MAKFLDENGVKKLWSRIQEYVYECCCSKGGGGDVGYECQGGYEALWEGSITVETAETSPYYAEIPYTKLITADKLRVTFDGVVYECNKEVIAVGNIYGGNGDDGYDFSNYPFAIFSGIEPSGSVYNEIATKTESTHTLKIETDNTVVTTTECFQKAVKSVGDSGYECTTSLEEAFSESGATEEQKGPGKPSIATLSYTGFIDVDEIKVVFNGTEYTCPKKVINGDVIYGSTQTSFTDYPFLLSFSKSNGNVIFTKEPVDFDITVFAPVTTATVTPCFETAVKTAMGNGNGVKVVHIGGNLADGFTCDTSCDEINAIIQNGGYLVAYFNGYFYSLDNVPKDWVNSTSVAKATPTLKVEVKTIAFSRVFLTSEKVVKEIFEFNSFNCNISYSEKAYPAK